MAWDCGTHLLEVLLSGRPFANCHCCKNEDLCHYLPLTRRVRRFWVRLRLWYRLYVCHVNFVGTNGLLKRTKSRNLSIPPIALSDIQGTTARLTCLAAISDACSSLQANCWRSYSLPPRNVSSSRRQCDCDNLTYLSMYLKLSSHFCNRSSAALTYGHCTNVCNFSRHTRQ